MTDQGSQISENSQKFRHLWGISLFYGTALKVLNYNLKRYSMFGLIKMEIKPLF